jgi:hypothetical protein
MSHVADGKITRIWIIRNPSKLSRWADRASAHCGGKRAG